MTILYLKKQIQEYIEEKDGKLSPLQRQWSEGYRAGLIETLRELNIEITTLEDRIQELEMELDESQSIQRSLMLKKAIKELKGVLGR